MPVLTFDDVVTAAAHERDADVRLGTFIPPAFLEECTMTLVTPRVWARRIATVRLVKAQVAAANEMLADVIRE